MHYKDDLIIDSSKGLHNCGLMVHVHNNLLSAQRCVLRRRTNKIKNNHFDFSDERYRLIIMKYSGVKVNDIARMKGKSVSKISQDIRRVLSNLKYIYQVDKEDKCEIVRLSMRELMLSEKSKNQYNNLLKSKWIHVRTVTDYRSMCWVRWWRVVITDKSFIDCVPTYQVMDYNLEISRSENDEIIKKRLDQCRDEYLDGVVVEQLQNKYGMYMPIYILGGK